MVDFFAAHSPLPLGVWQGHADLPSDFILKKPPGWHNEMSVLFTYKRPTLTSTETASWST